MNTKSITLSIEQFIYMNTKSITLSIDIYGVV